MRRGVQVWTLALLAGAVVARPPWHGRRGRHRRLIPQARTRWARSSPPGRPARGQRCSCRAGTATPRRCWGTVMPTIGPPARWPCTSGPCPGSTSRCGSTGVTTPTPARPAERHGFRRRSAGVRPRRSGLGRRAAAGRAPRRVVARAQRPVAGCGRDLARAGRGRELRAARRGVRADPERRVPRRSQRPLGARPYPPQPSGIAWRWGSARSMRSSSAPQERSAAARSRASSRRAGSSWWARATHRRWSRRSSPAPGYASRSARASAWRRRPRSAQAGGPTSVRRPLWCRCRRGSQAGWGSATGSALPRLRSASPPPVEPSPPPPPRSRLRQRPRRPRPRSCGAASPPRAGAS